jgi:hypothetical protein
MLYLTAAKRDWPAFRLLAFLAASILLACPIYGQVVGATLSGTVKDPSGAIVPHAQIAIKNVATQINTVATTNSEGFYAAPNLLPGTYQVEASARGFATAVQSSITLTVGAQQVLNFVLTVGQVSEKVQVTGIAPAVELASSSIGAVVDAKSIVDLPLNGRDWTQLATLQPGVYSIQSLQIATGATTTRGNRGIGNEVSISGTRPQSNNYRLDGISILDYANGSPGSVLGVTLGVDAIAEFSVLTTNYSAEYGRTSGGVVNAVTRSGTNQIHGDAYWFLRDGKLDARNYFDTTKPPFHRNLFGVSAGGPIRKDKTFFFANYEGFRQDQSSTTIANVPSQDARNGILHNADGTTTTITVDPVVPPYFGLYPLPNAGLVGTGDTGLFKTADNATTSEDFYTVRIDQKFSQRDSIFGTWVHDAGSDKTPDVFRDGIFGNTSSSQTLALEETHTFSPSVVNSIRGGYHRVVVHGAESLQAVNPLITDVSLGTFPGLPTPQLSITGLTDFTTAGVGPYTGDYYVWNSFQTYDDAFLTKGQHSIKFGFAFERMQTHHQLASRPTGSFNFDSLADFLTNHPKKFRGQLPSTNSARTALQYLFGGYIQDDWRVRSNLTLNLGLRYEAVTVPTEDQNKLVNLLTFSSPPPGHLGSPYFNNPTLRNLEPRVGFSWDPFHDGKTAVRGAFGIYDILPLNNVFIQTESQSAPFSQVLAVKGLPPGSFPKGPAEVTTIPPTQLRTNLIDPNPRRNYVMHWNLNVQRQLTPSITAMVAYVANSGVHMENISDDDNLVIPTLTPQGYLWPAPAGSGTILNPTVGAVRGIFWDGNALYHALQVGVSKRMSHGLQVQGSYTWGKSIDTGSSISLGNTYVNSITSLLWFCNWCRRGLSDFNIAHNLAVNYIWDVPAPKNWGAVGSFVWGGWQLGGIITAQTGTPFTPLIGGDPLGTNNTESFAYPNRLTGSGCSSAVNPGHPSNYVKLNCFGLPLASASLNCSPFGAPDAPIAGTCANLLGNVGRNSVIGPGLVTFDASLFKNNYIRRISETFNVQFRAEFFNVLNRPNFAVPVDNSTFFDANGNPVGAAGSVDKTSTTAREIQLALKVIW